MTFPGICVVIPAFNSEKTIRRALASVASQTLRPQQVIVVDDASTDNTATLAEGFAGTNVEVVRLPYRIGASGARNVGIRHATADLVAFLDSDDEWLPAKLERQVEVLLAKPQYSFVSCRTDLISPGGDNLGDTFGEHTVTVGEHAWKALLENNYVTTPSFMVWRRYLEELGGFNSALKIAEDQDMWIRLAERGWLGYVPECLVYEHEHASRLSGGGAEDQLMYTLPMIEGHVARFANRLTTKEMRLIRGRRYLRIGQLVFARGEKGRGRSLVYRAVRLGYEPLEGLKFLARTSALAMWLKHILFQR